MWAAIIAAVGAIVAVIIQSSQNKDLAEYQADRNEQYLKEQQEYNSPLSQMNRFKEADLNPNLIYGQGNPGNQSAPLSFPDIKPTDFTGALKGAGDVGMNALQAKLTAAQTQNASAKTVESQARAGLTEIQKSIAEKNPYLNKAAYGAMIESFISNAVIKSNEAVLSTQKKDFMTEKRWYETGPMEMTSMSNGYAKMSKELELLDQKFKLSQVDQKIKAEILESKEFQNAILEVQKKFMTDGDLTPQHIVAFAQLLLMKLVSK